MLKAFIKCKVRDSWTDMEDWNKKRGLSSRPLMWFNVNDVLNKDQSLIHYPLTSYQLPVTNSYWLITIFLVTLSASLEIL